MSMRTKPDVSGFLPVPKDPTTFLNGAEAVPEAKTVTRDVPKPEPTVQKLFRLRWEVVNALKAGAAQESATSRRRVTETEIVERLLREHYGLDS